MDEYPVMRMRVEAATETCGWRSAEEELDLVVGWKWALANRLKARIGRQIPAAAPKTDVSIGRF